MKVYTKFKLITTLNSGKELIELFEDTVNLTAYELVKRERDKAILKGFKCKIIPISTNVTLPVVIKIDNSDYLVNLFVNHNTDITQLMSNLLQDDVIFEHVLKGKKWRNTVYNIAKGILTKLYACEQLQHASNLRLKASDYGGYDNVIKQYNTILGEPLEFNANNTTQTEYVASVRDFFRDKQTFASDFKKRYNKHKKAVLNPYSSAKQLILSNGLKTFKNALRNRTEDKNINNLPLQVLEIFGVVDNKNIFTLHSVGRVKRTIGDVLRS